MSVGFMTRHTDDRPAQQERPRKGLSRRQREALAAYLFLLPDVLGLALFLGLPMLFSLGLGFFESDGFGNFKFIGLANYTQMFVDDQFLLSLRITLIYVFFLTPLLFIVSLILALLLRQKIPFVGVLRSAFFMPYVVSLVVIGFIWRFMLSDQTGVISQILQTLHLPAPSWLGDPNMALWTVILVNVWFGMGYYMIIFLAGLQDIPREYYEAAQIDGASSWGAFRYITWPLLKPTSFFVLLVSIVSSVSGSQGFDLIYVMTKGGPAQSTSLGIFYIYQQAFQFGHYGYAAAMASFIVGILLVATLIMFALTKGGRFESN